MTTVSQATHITINAANTVPTNVQVVLQGQSLPVSTSSSGCVTAGKGGGKIYQPNRNDIGWLSVSGAASYNIYRAKNGGSYSLLANITASSASTNYTNYIAGYPTQTQTYGTYLSGPTGGTQASPASSIDSVYTDLAATGIASANGQAGTTFNAVGNLTQGSTSVTITSVISGSLTTGQGIATKPSITGIQIGSTIVTPPSGGGTGTCVISQAALANQTGVSIGSVNFGDVGYTYYVTAVISGVESGASAFAYLPFITNGGLVLCNGTFDSCMGTQQTAPATTPLGYSKAACWFPGQPAANYCNGHYVSYLNAFSGNSAINYNLNVVGYNWINISFCPNISGLSPNNQNLAEVCGDVGLQTPTAAQMAQYGPASWTQNQWNTYKLPISLFLTDQAAGCVQTAMYKITWGINNSSPPAGTTVYIEYYFTVN